MPTHLFCLLPARSRVIAPTTPAVRTLTAGAVVAWVEHATASKLSRDARDATRATIEHDRVVSAALAQGVTPVPALLADPYEDDVAAAADIASHSTDIDAALDRIHGMVEMTVVIGMSDSSPAPDAPGRGRAYLEQLRSLPDRAAAVAERLTAELQEIGGTPRRRAEGGRVGLSHLILRTRVDDYRRLAQSHVGTGYRIVIDGPRAPYSFVRFSPRIGMVSDPSSAA